MICNLCPFDVFGDRSVLRASQTMRFNIDFEALRFQRFLLTFSEVVFA